MGMQKTGICFLSQCLFTLSRQFFRTGQCILCTFAGVSHGLGCLIYYQRNVLTLSGVYHGIHGMGMDDCVYLFSVSVDSQVQPCLNGRFPVPFHDCSVQPADHYIVFYNGAVFHGAGRQVYQPGLRIADTDISPCLNSKAWILQLFPALYNTFFKVHFCLSFRCCRQRWFYYGLEYVRIPYEKSFARLQPCSYSKVFK